MLAQEALQDALRGQYQKLKSKNPAFSIRAFAKRLELNSGALSSIMNGRRKVSPKFAQSLMEKLALPPEETARFESLLAVEKARREPEIESRRTLELRSDQFHLIADGIHFALLALMETQDFQSDENWIALRLDETTPRVRQALARLLRLELVSFERGQWIATGIQVRTSDGIADLAIRRFHEDRLEEARVKLHSVPVEDRDFFCSTLAVRRSQVPLARKLIRDFKKKMAMVLEQGPKDEVYRLCFQLYPVTRLKARGEKK